MGERQSALENLEITSSFWRGKRVFLTGHTGFKGAWLSLWLQRLDVQLTGYALLPPTEPNLFDVASVADGMRSIRADIRDLERLKREMIAANPDIVIHLAAQPLVRDSYNNPLDTYSINVMGTVHTLEAVRATTSVRAILNVTSDKCYRSSDLPGPYREDDPLGGFDPYSSSKACADLVATAYRASFFPADRYSEHGVALATARSGNVIGGGDWARDRLLPDLLRAIESKAPATIRNPGAIRPWQHVLEPLRGYLMLAERLYQDGPRWGQAWNFGPAEDDHITVAAVARHLVDKCGTDLKVRIEGEPEVREAACLRLDSGKTNTELGWRPRWSFEQSANAVVDWHRAYLQGKNMHAFSNQHIRMYLA